MKTALLKQVICKEQDGYIANTTWVSENEDFYSLLVEGGVNHEPNTKIIIPFEVFKEIAVKYFLLPKRKTCKLNIIGNIIAAPEADITYEIMETG
jgi:hypothetical protein